MYVNNLNDARYQDKNWDLRMILAICNSMGESSKFPKSWTFEIQILKLAVWFLNCNFQV